MKKALLALFTILNITVMNAQNNQTYLTLNNGVRMPQFGLGVYSIPAGDVTYNSVLTALKCGHRHIDDVPDGAPVRQTGRPWSPRFV